LYCMFNGRYVFYSETFKLQLSSINLHNFSSSLFRSLETCPSRSCCITWNQTKPKLFKNYKKIKIVKYLILMTPCRQIPECSTCVADDGQAWRFQLVKKDLKASVFSQNWPEKKTKEKRWTFCITFRSKLNIK
jgi:hypothetical protein